MHAGLQYLTIAPTEDAFQVRNVSNGLFNQVKLQKRGGKGVIRLDPAVGEVQCLFANEQVIKLWRANRDILKPVQWF